MFIAGPDNYARDALSFLSTSVGQGVLVLASVLFIVLVKCFARPSGEHAVRADDLAVGPDLLILAIITLIGYAASQFVTETHAEAAHKLKVANLASAHELNAAVLSFALMVLLLFETLTIQRYGQYSPQQRVTKRRAQLEAALQNNPQAYLDAVRYKPALGLIVPGLLGVLMLIIAIKSAVQ